MQCYYSFPSNVFCLLQWSLASFQMKTCLAPRGIRWQDRWNLQSFYCLSTSFLSSQVLFGSNQENIRSVPAITGCHQGAHLAPQLFLLFSCYSILYLTHSLSYIACQIAWIWKKNESLCVQRGVDVSLIVSTQIMACFYISNLFYKNDNHNLYTMLSLQLAIQLVHLTYFLSFLQFRLWGVSRFLKLKSWGVVIWS